MGSLTCGQPLPGSRAPRNAAARLLQMKQEEDDEEEEVSKLLEFAESLDFEKYVEDLDVRDALEKVRALAAPAARAELTRRPRSRVQVKERIMQLEDDSGPEDDDADGDEDAAAEEGAAQGEGADGAEVGRALPALCDCRGFSILIAMAPQDAAAAAKRRRKQRRARKAQSLTEELLREWDRIQKSGAESKEDDDAKVRALVRAPRCRCRLLTPASRLPSRPSPRYPTQSRCALCTRRDRCRPLSSGCSSRRLIGSGAAPLAWSPLRRRRGAEERGWPSKSRAWP